jgi:hypothetical protein
MTPRCSSAVRYNRIRISTSSQVVFSPGSTSISANVGSCGEIVRDVHGWISSAASCASHAMVATRSTTT